MATRQQMYDKRMLYEQADEYRKKALEKIERGQKTKGEMYTFSRFGIDESKLDFTNRSSKKDIQAGLNEVKDFVEHPAKYRVAYLEEEKKNPKYRYWVLSSELKEYDEMLSAENRTKASRLGVGQSIQDTLKEQIGQGITKSIVTKKKGKHQVSYEDKLITQDFRDANDINIIKLPSGRILGQKGLEKVLKKYKLEKPQIYEMNNVRRNFRSNLGNLKLRSTTSVHEKNLQLRRNFINALKKQYGISDEDNLNDIKDVYPELSSLIRIINRMPLSKFMYLFYTSEEFQIGDFVYSKVEADNKVARIQTQVDNIKNLTKEEQTKLNEFTSQMTEAGLI